MTNRVLTILWGVLYAVCAGLGFIPAPKGIAWGLMVFFSLVFFLPPFVLLNRASRAGDTVTLKRLRTVALIWLAVTVVMILLNILSVAFSELAGTVLYYFLILLTAPMICSQVWLLPLFLWACLMIAAWMKLRTK